MDTRSIFLLLCALWFSGVKAVLAAGTFPPLLYAAEGASKILRYDSEGKVAWEYPAQMARDVWALPNGNVLFCFNRDYEPSKHDNPSGVLEVTQDKQIVFSFSTTGQVWSCQRMRDGSTLVGASSQGSLLVVDPKTQVVQSIRLLSSPGHSCLRNARQLANGNFLVAEESARAAREYSSGGELVREIKVAFAPYSVIRLDNGNTVICGQQSAVEVDPADRILWSVKGNDFPELGIRWFAGLQILPNGNRFFCNAGGKVPFLEMTLDKRILWQSPVTMSIPLGHGIHRLDIAKSLQK
jgi:hypothetical protein